MMNEQPSSPEHPSTEHSADETRETLMNESQADDTQPVAGPAGQAGSEPAPTLWGEGRHPVHVAHLVMGIAFAGLLLVWALLYTGAAGGDDVQWLLPLPWLLAGAAGLAAAGRNARRRA